MLLHNYIANFYDVTIMLPETRTFANAGDELRTETQLWLDVLGEDNSEPLGWFVPVVTSYETRYSWVNICSNMETTSGACLLTEKQVRQLVKNKMFDLRGE